MRVKPVEGQPRPLDRMAMPVGPTPHVALILCKLAKALNCLAPRPGECQSAEMQDGPDEADQSPMRYTAS